MRKTRQTRKRYRRKKEEEKSQETEVGKSETEQKLFRAERERAGKARLESVVPGRLGIDSGSSTFIPARYHYQRDERPKAHTARMY